MKPLLPLFEASGIFLGFLIFFVRIPSLTRQTKQLQLVHVASTLAIVAGLIILTFQSCRIIHPGFSVLYMSVVITSVAIDTFQTKEATIAHLLPVVGACVFAFTIVVKALSTNTKHDFMACSLPVLCILTLSIVSTLIHFVRTLT